MKKETALRAIAVVGPTASGKTALSLALARLLPLEIISCDSMQIYREMDVGTAKASASERTQAVHHMIDVLDASTPYSAADYGEDAYACAKDIAKRGLTPLFCGGTGFYLDAAVSARHTLAAPSDPRIREALLFEAQTEDGRVRLYTRLQEIDPSSAAAIPIGNIRRVIRALEVYETTGKTKSELDKESAALPKRIELFTVLLDFEDRTALYGRIENRVDAMLTGGLEAEARRLYERGLLCKDTTAGQAIGYKEFLSYFDGEIPLSEVRERIIIATRRYAKRQLTWFHSHDVSKRILLDTCEQTASELAASLLPDLKAFLTNA